MKKIFKTIIIIIILLTVSGIITYITTLLPINGWAIFEFHCFYGEPKGLPFAFIERGSIKEPMLGDRPLAPLCARGFSSIALLLDIIFWLLILVIALYLYSRYKNQSDQLNISQEPQPSIQPEIPQKPGLSTWAIVLIVILSIAIVGLISYGTYQYFATKPVEEPTAVEEELDFELGAYTLTTVSTSTLAIIPQEHLDLIYKNYEFMPISFSENGEKFAYACGDFVVVNGQEHQKFGPINLNHFIFSPNGQGIAYVADKGKLIVNSQMIKEHNLITQLKFSPDSQKLVYIATEHPPTPEGLRGGYFTVILDGEESKKYYHISTLTFSPDSQNFAYVARKEKEYPEENNIFVVVNGKEGKKYAYIEGPSFSPDSQKVSYIARFTGGGDGFIVVNGEETKKSYYTAHGLTFSPDSQKLAFIARERKLPRREFHVLYDLETKEYWEGERHDGEIRNILFSPDSQKITYVVKEYFVEEGAVKEGKEFVVVNDKEGEKYNRVWGLIFSPDGQRVAYIAPEGENIAVAVNRIILEDATTRIILNNPERESYPLRSVGGLIFSPDGQKLAYVVNNHIIINGLKDEKYDYDRIWKLEFSPDSKKIMHKALESNKLISVVAELIPVEEPTEQSLDKWEYKSKKYGFSIGSLPVKVPIHKCNFDESVQLYKPTGGEKDYVEIKALEWEKGVYFYYDYTYKLEGIKKGASPRYEKCYKKYAIDELLDENSENHVSKIDVWNITVKDINDEEELLDFIKERYGDKCVIGEKILNQNNIYDVAINYQTHSVSYVVKYSPQNKKAATWMLGSDNKFFNEQYEPLDRKIEDSFKFIEIDETTDWPTYQNEEYGFQLTLTDAWKEYKTNIRSDRVRPSVKYIEFQIPIKDRYAAPFGIAIYPVLEWEKEQQEEGPKPKYIAQNENYVFGYFNWQDVPEDFNVNLEVIKIISTFKFIE